MCREPARYALLSRLLIASMVFALSACGGDEKQDFGPRPLPDVQQALRSGEYRSEEFEPSLSLRVPDDIADWLQKIGMCSSDCGDFFRLSSGGPPLAFRGGARARVIVLDDVKGERVIAGFGSPAAGFDEHAQEAQKVIDTVEGGGQGI